MNKPRTQDSNRLTFKNVFSDAILSEAQIKETVIEQASNVILGPTRIVEILQMEEKKQNSLKKNEKAFSRSVRQCEEMCKIDEAFSLIDYSIKAPSRLSEDLDRAYFDARQDLTVWSNVKEGNTLLLEHNMDEDGRLKRVSTLRTGLPKFYPLSFDAISETKRKLLPANAVE